MKDERRGIVLEKLKESSIIKEERKERKGKNVINDIMSEGNIDENKDIMIEGLIRREKKEGLIVIEGNKIIENNDRIVEIQNQVLQDIDV